MKRPYYVIYEWDADGKAKAYRYSSPSTRTKETLSPAQAGRLKNVTDLTKGDKLPAPILYKNFGPGDAIWPATDLTALKFNNIGWDDIDKNTKDAIHEECKTESPSAWIQDLWDGELHPEDYMDSDWNDLLIRCIHDVELGTSTRWGHTSTGDYGWGV